MKPYDEAADYLLTNLETVCNHLFPGGKREGANFIVGSITGQPGRSFSIALEPPTKRGLYKDFANGDKGSRNLPKLWKIVRGIPEDNHARFFQDLSAFAGMSFDWNTRAGSSNCNDFDWPGALNAFSQADAQRLANHPKRQYKVETVNWLHANGYLGLYRGKITFAMRDQTGNVVGVHRWFESEGKLKFLRSPTLLVIGDPSKATILHIHESVWDLVAMIDRTDWHLDANILLFCTRGVPGAKLVAGRIPSRIQKVYMWEQRDPPEPDGHSPNQKWQTNVAATAGIPFYVVPIPQGCKDLNEWTIGLGAISPATADGLKLACDMALLYKAAPRQAKPPGQPIQSTPQDFPPPEERPCFRLHRNPKTINDRQYAPGVYHHAVKHSGETVYAIDNWLCAPLEAIAKTADNRDSDYGRLLKYTSSKGEEKLWAMPMELLAGDGAEVLSQLLRDGLEISHPHRRKILEYIAQTKPFAFKRCATRTGWHSEEVFVLTEEVIGSSDVWFQASSRTADYLRGGTLDGWKKHVAALAKGNVYLVFAISFSLAGPLMERPKLQGIGCHLFGDSTSGKTSVAEAAASVWGHGHAFMQTWNTTSNALEGVCAEHSDTVLVLDEIKEIDGRDLDRVAYSAMNGQGKIRATRIGAMRPPLLWRVALLSTGEYSIRARLAEIGIVIKAGQELRLVDVPVIGEKDGIFSNLHGAKDGAQFANALRAAASEHYGHAGPEIVRVILGSDPKVLRKKHAEILELFQTTNAQEIRVARMFATAALAGELAAAHQLVDWQCSSSNDYSVSDSANAAVSLFNRWRQNREANSTFGTEHSSIMQLISDALEKHTDSRFSDLNQVTCVSRANPTVQIPPPMIRDRLGWFDDSSGNRIYLLLTSGLREIAKGFDFKRVLSALDAAGAFAKKGTDTPAIPTRLPDGRLLRLYHIDPQKLGS